MDVDITRHRLHNHRIVDRAFDRPDQPVAWFGAMQAQDYAGVKWAIGLRCRTISGAAAAETNVEQAIGDKTVIRTWLQRGTLQVVAATDIHWMLALLAPRLIAQSARRRRQLELDDIVLTHSAEIITRLLQGHKQLTRANLLQELEQAGISTPGARGYHILRHAGLEGLICFGPMQGKEQTFVLLDEWVPRGKQLPRDEALAELAGRYFNSHGPAALADFVWWSGLPKMDARSAIEMAQSQFHAEIIDGETYWLPPTDLAPEEMSPTAHLLPAYDEYYLGYKNRDAILNASYDKKAVSSSGVFRPMIVVDGQIVGTWKQKFGKGNVIITPNLFKTLTANENQALHMAANRYGAFLGLSVVM
jgi:hypothetical protein